MYKIRIRVILPTGEKIISNETKIDSQQKLFSFSEQWEKLAKNDNTHLKIEDGKNIHFFNPHLLKKCLISILTEKI